MPEPSPDQNAAGETSPSSGWWSRFHSPTDPDHDETVTDETDPADDVALPDAPTSAPPRAVWPEGWAVVPPVGSIVTDVGVTFSLAPASPTDRPMRVRCTSCDWDKTAPSHRPSTPFVSMPCATSPTHAPGSLTCRAGSSLD